MEFNSQPERASKAEAVAVLFALFPGRDPADAGNVQTRIRAHVELAADIPAPLYAAACTRIAKTWTYPSTPNPGDIRKAAHKAAMEIRTWERACAQRERQVELERGAMSVVEARAELDRIASDPAPMNGFEAVALEIYIGALRARVSMGEPKRLGRPNPLKAIDGGDSAA